MPQLTYRNYSFASLPSGTYLFFPLVSPEDSPTARLAGADDEGDPDRGPSRLVVSMFHGGACEPELLGVTEGKTIFVTLESERFEQLLSTLQARGRTLRRDPIQFGVELAADGSVRNFDYPRDQGRELRASDVVPGAAAAASTKASGSRG